MSAAKNLLAVGFSNFRWSRYPLSEPSDARRGVEHAVEGITRTAVKTREIGNIQAKIGGWGAMLEHR